MINRIEYDWACLAARVVFDEADKDGRQMAFAVADEAGNLVFAASMDECPARILVQAVRKAYTSAVMRRDTIKFRDDDLQRGNSLAEWGDSMLTHLIGGVVVHRHGDWFGGAAVGGNVSARDDEIARLAVRALVKDA